MGQSRNRNNNDDERLLKRQEEEISILRRDNKKLKEDNIKLNNRIKALEDTEERSIEFIIFVIV